MLQYTIAGGRTKGANDRSFVFVHQHGGDDVTYKLKVSIECFHSRDQKPCFFTETKENVSMIIELNPGGLVGYTNMAADPLVWYTKMAAVTSCENTLYGISIKRR